MKPGYVAHADWGTRATKRWLAWARPEGSSYFVGPAEPVGDAGSLVARAIGEAAGGSALIGFDFPIGLPRRYAEAAGITSFLELLPKLGEGEWHAFYDVATSATELNLRRPFYPMRPGGTRQAHLFAAHGVERLDDLRRRCELAHPGRSAASPLFWTLGGKQVGKAAISGWREVLTPALRDPTIDAAVWPFDGDLDALQAPGRVVFVETYPAEYYPHLGVAFRGQSKRNADARRANSAALFRAAAAINLRLHPTLRDQIDRGFGDDAAGEDRFDAVVGALGMLNVVLGNRLPGAPDDPAVRSVEGWILGQASQD
jgi:hypothetical protein